MVANGINDIRVENIEEDLVTPIEIRERYPLTGNMAGTVLSTRAAIEDVLDGKDPRKIVVVGPCSVHDIEAAKEYTDRLKSISDKVNDVLIIVGRFYFEKPRTTTGWRGLVRDPDLNGSFDINKGLGLARELLCYSNSVGVPAATEFLNTLFPQHYSDLISWAAIGARTTEADTHRELVSGLSMPVGYKNPTSGDISIAVNAVISSSNPMAFPGINYLGRPKIIRTKGHPYTHVVLRGGNGVLNGGKHTPNYESQYVAQAQELLRAKGLRPNVMIDCSHSNSKKKPENQPRVLDNVVQQIYDGNQHIIGVMLESNLCFGSQTFDLSGLKYGVSITDGCIDIAQTGEILNACAATLRRVINP
ncbi:MAG: 3-deoxy-7-phosphoheptulonate synthase [Candidatus Woesearchaeota archaeon]